MKKLLTQLIAFFLVFTISFQEVSAKVKWEPLKTPQGITRIIGGNSLNDFWVLDNNNLIYHFNMGRWDRFPHEKTFPRANYRFYNPILVGKNHVFVLMTTYNWRTHIAEINNGKVIRYNIVTKKPLYRITRVSNTFYATGDFGLILKLENGQWKEVSSPVHTHIFAETAGKKGTFWMGTQSEGVFAYNGKTFRHFPLPKKEAKSAVTKMLMLHDTLFINTEINKSYKLCGTKFYPIPESQTPFHKKTELLKNGYYKIVSQDNKVFFIPYFFRIQSFKPLHDGHALLLSSNHQLFYNRKISENFFLNFAALYGLKGPEYSFIPFNIFPGKAEKTRYQKMRPAILLADFNQDLYEDILLFNVSDERHPFLYLNDHNHYFNNFSGPQGLDQFTFNGMLSYAFDLNGDDIPEIIFTDFRDNHSYLNILEKTTGKYRLSQTLPLPEKYSTSPLQYLSFTDIDKDGNLDMALTFGYSVSGKGTILFLKNNGYGYFEQPDTTWEKQFSGWNVQTIFADFDNDGRQDMFVSRNWGSNVIFFHKATGWKIKKLNKTPYSKLQQRKGMTLAFDYDNDADLDIITLAENPFIRLLENDGKGNFRDITEKSGLNKLNTGIKSGHITAADFNNNGFTDLFIVARNGRQWENYLFLNDSSKQFLDRSKEMNISNSMVEFAAAGDIDNDGDIDLYAFKQGNNILWLNNLNSNNFLQFRLTGIKSNSEAIGTKIWLYEAGHIGNNNYLSGYRQTGSKLTGWGYQNESIVHFGVNNNKKYDVRIVFPAGKTKILRNLLPGRTIHVTEISAPVSWFYLADNKARILIRDKEFLSYLTVILLGLFFLMFTIQYGTKKFRWDVRLATIIMLLNLIIFAILLFVLYRNGTDLKYYLPLAVIFSGSFGPLGFFLWIKRFSGLKSEKENDYALFQSLQNFAHGAWAASNLNSLQLFFENMSVEDLRDNNFLQPFEKRKETFFNLTLPVINEIISLSDKSSKNRELLPEIIKNKNGLVRFLSSDISHIGPLDKTYLTTAIMKLREALSLLKNVIFAGHSCYPSLILNNLREELEKLAKSHNINLKIIHLLSDKEVALMDVTALANILDNCIRNAIKAMENNPEKRMIIKFIKSDPRIFIEITDNGKGIPETLQEKIFENGFSTSGSTGYGLFYAKETLKKYGGRIYVKNSIPRQRTTFVIELQKGSKK